MAGLFQATSKQRNPLGPTIRTHGSVKLETEMSHEFHDLFRPGLQKALIIGTLIKA